MQPNAEQIMKQITKAALSALFAIGVTSPANIDKFVNHFSEELMKNYPLEPEPEDVPLPPLDLASGATSTTKGENKPEVDIQELIKDEDLVKFLRGAGINTINQLSLEMQKRSLTEIPGIEPRMEDEIREALVEWNKS